jgi:hypothetical protein
VQIRLDRLLELLLGARAAVPLDPEVGFAFAASFSAATGASIDFLVSLGSPLSSYLTSAECPSGETLLALPE